MTLAAGVAAAETASSSDSKQSRQQSSNSFRARHGDCLDLDLTELGLNGLRH